jgi:hypothetical protein
LAIEAILEPAAGGRASSVHDTGEAWGKVRMLAPSWPSSHRSGGPSPGVRRTRDRVPPGSSTVEVTLTPRRSGTHVRLEHHDLPAAEIEATTAGWAGMPLRLSEAVSEA